MKDPLANQIVRTRRDALRLARLMGCEGAHEVESGWQACESEEAFQALITGGAAGYRAVQEKALGRAIGAVRRVATPNSPGRAKRNVRRVAIDPNARDADGDQLVQEGTTAERRAGRAAQAVGKQPRARSVKPSRRRVLKPERIKPFGPKESGTPNLPGPRQGATSLTNDANWREIIAARRELRAQTKRILADERQYYERSLKRAEEKIVANGGWGRPRSLLDGPHPDAARQVETIRQVVERRFGKLESLEDYQTALHEVFPNATFDLFSVARNGQAKNPFKERHKPQRFDSEADMMIAFGDDTDVVVHGLKSAAQAMLFKGMEDPQTASRIGAILIENKTAPYAAAAGPSITNPVDAPLSMYLNPHSWAADMVRLQDDDTVMRYSNLLAEQLAARETVHQLQPEKRGQFTNITQTMVMSDSDIDVHAHAIIMHEWGHMVGFANQRDSLSDAYLEPYRKWVNNPGSRFTGNALDGKKLKDAEGSVAFHLASILGKTSPAEQRAGQRFLADMGFSGVNINDPAQVAAVYRALAVRAVLAHDNFRTATTKSHSMSEADWMKISGMSGYANMNPEEGLAELYALVEMMPDMAAAKYRQGLETPAMKDRIR